MRTGFKMTVSLLLVIVLTAFAVFNVSAQTVYDYGNWKFVRLSDAKEYQLYSCTVSEAQIIVPSSVDGYKVTSIGAHAFLLADTVSNITLPETVTAIEDYAFADCGELREVVFPVSLTELGSYAFNETPALELIDLSHTGIGEISQYTFLNSGVTDVRLPDSCSTIGDYAFAQCERLKEVSIPSSVTEIGENAFSGSDQAIIYVEKDSFAHIFAVENDIPFVLKGETVYYLGDTDGDGTVTVLDATRIQKYLALVDIPDSQLVEKCGDIDGDGINILDATAIQKWLAKLLFPDGIGFPIK